LSQCDIAACGHHLIRTALAGGVEHQQPCGRVDPYPHRSLLGKCHGQQIELGFVLEIPAFLLAGFSAGFLFDALGLFLHTARQHAGGQHLGLDHEAKNPLPAHRLDQRPVGLASRRHPAQGFFLRCTAFHEWGLGQRLFNARQFPLPMRSNAVHDHVLEHGTTSCIWEYGWGGSMDTCWPPPRKLRLSGLRLPTAATALAPATHTPVGPMLLLLIK
jgi:hypothetical protein